MRLAPARLSITPIGDSSVFYLGEDIHGTTGHANDNYRLASLTSENTYTVVREE
jgi:hypothetical protein